MLNKHAINQNVLNGKINLKNINQRRGTIFFIDEEGFEYNLTEMCGANVDDIEGLQILSGPLYDAEFEIEILEKVIDDGGILINKRLATKTIALNFFLKEKNNYNLRKKTEIIKNLLIKKQGFLELKFFDGFRKVFGTFSKISFENLNFLDNYVFGKFYFTFLEPFFIKENGQILFNIGDGFFTKNYFLNGNYGNKFLAKINIESDFTFLNFKFGNTEIFFDDLFFAGDEVVLDSKENRVFLNGNEIAFLGNFLNLDFGENTLEIDTDGTFNFQIKINNLYI